MAETLGSAVLDLRVNDRGFKKGMDNAQQKALALGATFTAVGAGLTALTLSWTKSASDLNSVEQSIERTFDDMADHMIQTSRGAAHAMGLSASAYLDEALVMGAQLKNMGFEVDEFAKVTENALQRSADVAAFFNADTQEVVTAFSAGLRGETEPLKRFAVDVSVAAMQVEAQRLGMAGSVSEMDRYQKALLVLSIWNDKTADKVGQFAAESQDMTGAQRILSAEIENLSAKLGQGLAPILGAVLAAIVPVIQWAGRMAEKFPKATAAIAITMAVLGGILLVAGTFILAGGAIAASLTAMGITMATVTGIATAMWLAITGPIGIIVITIGLIVAALTIAYFKFDWFRNVVDSIFDFLATIIKNFGQLILFALAPFIIIPVMIIRNWEGIKDFFGNLWGGVTGIFSGAVEAIKKILFPNIGIPELLSEIWGRIPKIIQDILARVGNLFGFGGGSRSGAGSGVDPEESATSFFGGMVDVIKNYAPFILGALFPFIGIPVLIIRNWNDITKFFSNLWEDVSGFFRIAIDAIMAILFPHVGIPALIQEIWGRIPRIIQDILARVSDLFGIKKDADLNVEVNPEVNFVDEDLRIPIEDAVSAIAKYWKEYPWGRLANTLIIPASLVTIASGVTSIIWGAIKGFWDLFFKDNPPTDDADKLKIVSGSFIPGVGAISALWDEVKKLWAKIDWGAVGNVLSIGATAIKFVGSIIIPGSAISFVSGVADWGQKLWEDIKAGWDTFVPKIGVEQKLIDRFTNPRWIFTFPKLAIPLGNILTFTGDIGQILWDAIVAGFNLVTKGVLAPLLLPITAFNLTKGSAEAIWDLLQVAWGALKWVGEKFGDIPGSVFSVAANAGTAIWDLVKPLWSGITWAASKLGDIGKGAFSIASDAGSALWGLVQKGWDAAIKAGDFILSIPGSALNLAGKVSSAVTGLVFDTIPATAFSIADNVASALLGQIKTLWSKIDWSLAKNAIDFGAQALKFVGSIAIPASAISFGGSAINWGQKLWEDIKSSWNAFIPKIGVETIKVAEYFDYRLARRIPAVMETLFPKISIPIGDVVGFAGNLGAGIWDAIVETWNKINWADVAKLTIGAAGVTLFAPIAGTGLSIWAGVKGMWAGIDWAASKLESIGKGAFGVASDVGSALWGLVQRLWGALTWSGSKLANIGKGAFGVASDVGLAIWDAVKRLWGAIPKELGKTGGRLAAITRKSFDIAADVGTDIWSKVQGLWGTAITVGNAILSIPSSAIKLVGTVGAAITGLSFSAIPSAAFSVASDTGSKIWELVQGLWNLAKKVGDNFRLAWIPEGAFAIANTVGSWIWGKVQGLWNLAKKVGDSLRLAWIPEGAFAIASTAGEWLWNAVKKVWAAVDKVAKRLSWIPQGSFFVDPAAGTWVWDKVRAVWTAVDKVAKRLSWIPQGAFAIANTVGTHIWGLVQNVWSGVKFANNKLGEITRAAFQLATDIGTDMWAKVKTMWAAVTKIGDGRLAWIPQGAFAIANTIGTHIWGLVQNLWKGVSWAANKLANIPTAAFGVASGLAGVIQSGLKTAWDALSWTAEAVKMSVPSAALNFFSAAANTVAGVIRSGLRTAWNALTWVADAVRFTLPSAAINLASTVASTVASNIRSAARTAWGALTWLTDAVRFNIPSGAIQMTTSVASSIAGTIRTGIRTAWNALVWATTSQRFLVKAAAILIAGNIASTIAGNIRDAVRSAWGNLSWDGITLGIPVKILTFAGDAIAKLTELIKGIINDLLPGGSAIGVTGIAGAEGPDATSTSVPALALPSTGAKGVAGESGITININGPVYGVDDLNDMIYSAIRKAKQRGIMV